MKYILVIILQIALLACSTHQKKEIQLPSWQVITLKDLPKVFTIQIDSISNVQFIDSLMLISENWKKDTSFYKSSTPKQLSVYKSKEYTLFNFSTKNCITERYLVKEGQLIYTYFENGSELCDHTYYSQGIAFAFRIADSAPEWINEYDCEQFMKGDHWNFSKNNIRKLQYVTKKLKV